MCNGLQFNATLYKTGNFKAMTQEGRHPVTNLRITLESGQYPLKGSVQGRTVCWTARGKGMSSADNLIMEYVPMTPIFVKSSSLLKKVVNKVKWALGVLGTLFKLR